MLFFKVSDDTSYEFRKKERNPLILVYKFSLAILSNESWLQSRDIKTPETN